ncbi:RHS repeat-associated core domain-containing protein [Desmospora profundinema]|uniref:RHS repeat-associated protein n=1 Tax=Desmospora profundinema TaxID=1571184 RepID=A0ABU1IQW3_9BACL|nr:RHS repeat-associated core domain-containing protein [Desmospora profundinema]MDR6227192.1 RHS repeat-associated protein [Desmospora profundinema]
MEDVISEEVADEITKSYQYTPWGERLSMVKHNQDGSKEDSFYGYNTRTDVEVLTDENGNTRATYGYTAYGENDSKAFTGVDKPDPNNPDQEIYNPYRYSAKRFDPATGQYDMGFRDYDPGINRFLTRDMYNGALADMSLGMDPWTMNRYAFTGGNPVSRVELDGHDSICAPPLSCNPDHIQDAEKREAYDKEREALRQEATEAIAPFADLTWLGTFADVMSLIGGQDFWTGESKPRSESAANLAMTPVKPFKAVGSVLGFGARGASGGDGIKKLPPYDSDNYTTFWRVVQPKELEDLRKVGYYRNKWGMGEEKYFSTTRAGAIKYGEEAQKRYEDGPYTLTSARAPKHFSANQFEIEHGIQTVTLDGNKLGDLGPVRIWPYVIK